MSKSLMNEDRMTTLGKMIQKVAPKFVDRLLKLDSLKQEIIIEEVWVKFYNSDDHIIKLQNLKVEFNANKMWFMRREK